MNILVFDNQNKNLFYYESFSNFSPIFLKDILNRSYKSNLNEVLLQLIENTKVISNEIDLIITHIKSNYKPVEKYIRFNTTNLSNMSFLLENINSMADNYSNEKQKILEESIENQNSLINRYKEELNEYEQALKNYTLTDEDKYFFIASIVDKYIDNFPEDILNIYNKLISEDYQNTELNENDEEKYEKYILTTYSKEYEKFILKTIKNYPKNIKDTQNKINKLLKEYKDFKSDYSTCYFKNYIEYLENIKNTILFLEYQVKALNCIGYDDDTFKWDNITKEERLFLANIYVNPFKLNFYLPKSEIIYAFEENGQIKCLTDYACNSIIENKGKEFLNIINDFLQKNLFELQLYECKDIIEMINVLFYNYKIYHTKINKCMNCGKYFIPQIKSNERYCDNISPQNKNKTCKQFGVNKTYREAIKSSAIKTAHTQISQLFRMRIKRAQNKTVQTQEEKYFEKYKKEYQQEKQLYSKNKISESEFTSWIVQQKNKYKKI